LVDCVAEPRRPLTHRTDSTEKRVDGQPAHRWRRNREGRPNYRRSVNQRTENRQAADPVGECMLHDEDERDPTAGQPGDHRGAPQRMVHRQPTHDQLGGDFEHCRLVTRRRTGEVLDVSMDAETRVVDPYGPQPGGTFTSRCRNRGTAQTRSARVVVTAAASKPSPGSRTSTAPN
jgi:hypothetical protein